jgi:hypothetical protein
MATTCVSTLCWRCWNQNPTPTPWRQRQCCAGMPCTLVQQEPAASARPLTKQLCLADTSAGAGTRQGGTVRFSAPSSSTN